MAATTETSSLRKAAILFSSLDADSAAKLLAHLGPMEASKLRAAVREVGTIDEAELSNIASELQQCDDSEKQLLHDSGVELHGVHENTNPRLNTQLADLRHLASVAPSQSQTWKALLETDNETLLEFLEREQSQAIAMVLSYLPRKRAAETLAALPELRQTEVVQRLAELGDTDTESLREVEQSLETWLVEHSRRRERLNNRLSIVREIMAATQIQTRQTILMRLKHRDCDLARDIEKHLQPSQIEVAGIPAEDFFPHKFENLNSQPPVVAISFDELAEVPDRILSTVLATVDSGLLRCALAGANDRLLARVNRLLSRKQRQQLRNQLQELGPTNLRDMDAAQQMVAELASRLLAWSSGDLLERLTA